MNILSKRYWLIGLSILVILPGLVIALVRGLPLSIDFTGGSLLEIRFENAQTVEPAQIFSLLDGFGVKDVKVQQSEAGVFIIRFAFLEETAADIRSNIVSGAAFEQAFGGDVTVLRSESVGPTVGREVAGRAAIAVGVAAAAVLVYIGWAFRGLPHAFRYGVCAIIAMGHDVAVVLSLVTIGGLFLGWQVDALFLTALLTVIGFSVQDKIVVFDRIRENTTLFRRLPFETLVNHSIVQTLQRSINTQLMTVEFMLLSLALFGGVTLREFAVILLVGLFSGTYSSIFIASSSLVVWEKREWRKWFGRGEQSSAA